MLGTVIALFVNYGFNATFHRKIINRHAAPALTMCITMMGAAALLLATGMADVTIRNHIKASAFYVWCFSFLCLLFAIFIGLVPF